jgi:hypothetical protein
MCVVAMGACAHEEQITEQTTQATRARFAYEDIVALIQGQNLTSVEQVLPALPEELRSNYTLMHDSRSLQSASVDAPRAILFGADGRLTCAFAGDPANPGFDSLECFQFREEQRAFDFRQIRFPTAANGLTQVVFSGSNQSADGKTKCTSCHGADPRPNWDSYSVWPGAYGADDDSIGKDPSLENDASHYAGFVARRSTDARYRWLVQGPAATAPYMADYGGTIDSRPNLRFSDASNRMNALRVTRLLRQRVARRSLLAFAVAGLTCVLTDSQRRALTDAGIDPAHDLDLGAIFAQAGVSTGDWGTQIFNDP